jgi:hypothetical protein
MEEHRPMEVTRVPEIIYHVKITLTKEDLGKMKEYARSGPKYTGAHEFAELVKKISEAVEKA